jgi:protein phosphatase 1 regulatory subunit 7
MTQEVAEDATKFRLGIDVALPENAGAEEFQLHYTRLDKIEGLEDLTELRKLVFVATGLRVIENLENQALLEHLEIYQASISRISNILHLTNLRLLDLSFNKISHIEGLSTLVKLEKLYLSSNNISVIENLDALTSLKVLELGSNRISELSGLDHLDNLEELWLGKNMINCMRLPRTFTNLRILSLQSNRLTEWESLACVPAMEQLYLSSNKLSDPSAEVIASLPPTLMDLDIASNALTAVPRFTQLLPSLTELWLNDNQICDFDSLDYLKLAPALQTVYLEKNKVQSQVPIEYTKRMRVLCPKLIQLDAVPIIHLRTITEDSHPAVRSILRH